MSEELVWVAKVNKEDAMDNKGIKSVGSSGKAVSINRFAILANTCDKMHGDNSGFERTWNLILLLQKRYNLLALGNLKLMRSLKTKRKGLLIKVKASR